jgi:hypothetical protein
MEIFTDSSKALYIGANADILPMLAFPAIKTWFCIDALPFHESCCYIQPQKQPSFKRQFKFIQNLIFVYKCANFVTDFCFTDFKRHKQLVFFNTETNQTVHYFYSLKVDKIQPLPDHIRAQIGLSDTFVSSCTYSYQHFLGYLTTKFNFIYNSQPYDLKDDSIFLLKHFEMYDYFCANMKSIWRIDYTDEKYGHDHISDFLSIHQDEGEKIVHDIINQVLNKRQQNKLVTKLNEFDDLFDVEYPDVM